MKNAYFVYRGTKKPRIDGHKGSQLSNKPIGKGTKKSKPHQCDLDSFGRDYCPTSRKTHLILLNSRIFYVV